ncbi:MAG: VOC family protein [Porphyromonadaceae bacterium]|nr:VOC family protein [Porphyromonadaceae bacterium]
MNCKLNPFLAFDRQCAEAFEFYAKVFGGEAKVFRFREMPDGGPETTIPEEYADYVMYAELTVGQNVLMGYDHLPEKAYTDTKQRLRIGTNSYISISLEDRSEADCIFGKLAEGGKSATPMHDTFFGYFGSLVDRFGVQWMVHVESR